MKKNNVLSAMKDANAAVKETAALAKKLNKAASGSFVPISEASANVRTRFTSGLDVVDVLAGGFNNELGFTGGRVIELYGKAQTGKTTFGCGLIRQAQNDFGATGIIIDTESRLTIDRIRTLHVNEDMLLYDEESYVERVLEHVSALVEILDGKPAVVFWDTVAQSSSIHDRGKRVGEGRIARHAFALSDGLRRIAKPLASSRMLFVICNQLKAGKLGDPFATKRDKEGTLGGESIRFSADQRFSFSFARDIYEAKKIVATDKQLMSGFEVNLVQSKATNSPSGAKAILFFDTRCGDFSNALSTLSTLCSWGMFQKAAKTFQFNGCKYTRAKWVRDYPNIRPQAIEAIRERYMKLYGGD